MFDERHLSPKALLLRRAAQFEKDAKEASEEAQSYEVSVQQNRQIAADRTQRAAEYRPKAALLGDDEIAPSGEFTPAAPVDPDALD